MPSVSGRRAIFAGSVPAITAAACSSRAPAAPLDTTAASAPSIRAMACPALTFSSFMSTSAPFAASMACCASGRMIVPPYRVVVPPMWMIGRTPIVLYRSAARSCS